MFGQGPGDMQLGNFGGRVVLRIELHAVLIVSFYDAHGYGHPRQVTEQLSLAVMVSGGAL